MSNKNSSDDSGRQKRTRFATVKHTCILTSAADQYHVNFHVVTINDKLEMFFVFCTPYFMTWRQNLQYKVSSQQKLKTDDEYVPKSAHIKSGLAVEKWTKEGKYFQALSDKHSEVITDCQLKLKSLVIESGDLDLVKKRR